MGCNYVKSVDSDVSFIFRKRGMWVLMSLSKGSTVRHELINIRPSITIGGIIPSKGVEIFRPEVGSQL